MVKKMVVCLYFLFAWSLCQGQYHWWNEQHNWDGVTHWSQYMILSPAFMGPNALPVPDILNGKIKKDIELENVFQYHKGRGNQTQNLFNSLFIPLYSDKVGLKLSMVSVEYFSMDTITRDLWRSRNYEGTGYSTGDLYIGTQIQLTENHDRWPDVLLTINLRTASGSNNQSARFTDTPGYFFDLSAGKDFWLENAFLKRIRPFAMAGFYVWQTNTHYYQNDAYLFGAGLEIDIVESLSLVTSIGGYSGYINNGDKPMVYRAALELGLGRVGDLLVGFQHGIRDYPFNTLQIGIRNTFKVKNLR